jgi:hypothetical protein
MKWYWYIIMILIWAIAILLVVTSSWWYLLLILIALNLIEYLLAGLWFGRRAGTSFVLNLVLSLIFGFVWWSSLRESGAPGPKTPIE